jgi:LysM repeat protein
MILAGMLGFSARPAQAATCTKFHTVQKGEYLVQIGNLYGVHWRTLAELNNLANPSLIFPGQRLCISTDGAVPQPPPTKIPTFSIVSVDPDKSVTIRTANFPANDTFQVRMGEFGTQGIGGVLVETVNSGQGGSFTANFPIPASLRGLSRIAIRLQSPSSGYFSYNWFFNSSGGTGGLPPTNPPFTGIPTFSILSVVRDQTVTIQANNFPPNLTFVVRMGAMGTRGVNGIQVASFDSGAGGAFTKTFDIPAGLKGSARIAIRTENNATGYFSYNWFYNNTAN